MNPLLVDPTRVVVVSDEERIIQRVDRALEPGSVTEITSARNPGAVIEDLAANQDIGAVIVADETEDESLPETCEAIYETDPALPIVVFSENDSAELAHSATTAGASTYLLASVPDAEESLCSVIERALARYDKARVHREESAMLEALLHPFEFALFVKDTEARHLRMSKTTVDMSQDAFLGKTDLELYGNRERESYDDDMHVISEGERIDGKEIEFTTPDGTRWARITKVPWRDDDGEIKGLVGATRDITETKQLKDRVAKQRAQLNRVASYFTHDLRSPLQIAMGYLDQSLESGEPGPLENVETALERIDLMLDDLYDIVTEEADRTEVESPEIGYRLRPEETARPPLAGLSELVADVWDGVAAAEATLQYDGLENARINAPESAVRAVFENLIKNAIDHGGSDVVVRIGWLPEGGLYVEDTGPGIPVIKRDSVLEQGYTTHADGSGIGLSIVNDIATQHNWRLSITEGETGGARIEIRNCMLVPYPEIDHGCTEPSSLTTRSDVGKIAVESTVEGDDSTGSWSLTSGGRNTFSDPDRFHFVYTELSGPARLEGRIENIEVVTGWSSAGLMVRGDLTERAPFGQIGETARYGAETRWRYRDGENEHRQAIEHVVPDDPVYRIDSDGELVTTYVSADGTEWYPLDQRRIDLGDSYFIGIFVCSNIGGHPCTATFEDVTLKRPPE